VHLPQFQNPANRDQSNQCIKCAMTISQFEMRPRVEC
jgi:hypothetical protein